MQELGITTEQLPGIDIDAAIQRGIGDYGKMVTETGEIGEQTISDRSSIDSGENQTILPEGQRLETSEGEIYGFADQKGDLYFDETKVSPNGRMVDWDKVGEELELIRKAKYNKVFYDPASYAESNWQVTNGVK